MKALILLLLLPAVSIARPPENPRFKDFGAPIPARENLKVQWEVSTNVFPKKVWVYRLLPNHFSPKIIAGLITSGSFTPKDRTGYGTNGVTYQSRDHSRSLWVYFPLGAIQYQTFDQYSPTNLAKGVPDNEQMPELTTSFLKKIGINVSGVEKDSNGKPDFHFWTPQTIYFYDHAFVTNIAFRAVDFRRAVDGIPFVGGGTGGDCEIDFGEHGKISKIWLSWRNMERYKEFATISAKKIVAEIRNGKAVFGGVPMGTVIDWNEVKNILIKKAEACYYAGDTFAPSNWLLPYAALWATVDTERGNIEMEIDCPIIDATDP